MRQFIPIAFLLVAACGGPENPEQPASDAGSTPAVVESGVTDSATPMAEATEASAEGIPEAMRGRWGLVVADCEPGRADAKGLLVISADKLQFYESVGKLAEVSERRSSHLRANFAFTGEGMNWNRDMLLDLQQGGAVLVRQEFGADAAPEPLRYTRCS